MFATNTSGVKVWTAAYLPFGGVRVSTGTPPTARFPGQWFQSETGLHQNWMRDYDPTTGRYMQADPLGLVDGASVYGYALGNPGRYVDPRGQQSATATGGFDALDFAEWTCRYNPACRLGNFIGKVCIAGVQIWMHSTAGTDAAPIASSPAATSECENCGKDDCGQLSAQIEDLALSLQFRLEDLMVDQHDLFNTAPTIADDTGPGSWEGHQNFYDEERRTLRTLIAQADAQGCPVSEFARETASETAPDRPWR